jgi:hypothetical protein
MSKEEELPPDRISTLKISTLALDFSGSKKTIKQLASEADTDDMATEDMAAPYDENEGYDSRLEMLADKRVKDNVDRGKPSEGVPELVFSVPCINPAHTVSNNLAEGYFIIRGSSLATLLVAQVIKWADENLSQEGCGHPGCTITLDDCLQEFIEGEILMQGKQSCRRQDGLL